MDEKLTPQVDEEAWQAEIRSAQAKLHDEKRQQQNFNPYIYAVKLLAKVLVVTVLGLGLLMAWTYIDNALLPFDSVAWKSGQQREKQVGRLRRQVQLVGMTRKQVVQLLGQPSEVFENQMIYEIKNLSSSSFQRFVIYMKKERVERYGLGSD